MRLGAETLVLVHGSGTKNAASATALPAFIGENAPTRRPRRASSSQICRSPACGPSPRRNTLCSPKALPVCTVNHWIHGSMCSYTVSERVRAEQARNGRQRSDARVVLDELEIELVQLQDEKLLHDGELCQPSEIIAPLVRRITIGIWSFSLSTCRWRCVVASLRRRAAAGS